MSKGGLEQLWGAIFRGVPRAKVSANGAKEFSGITVLASGSATVTVSTTVVKSNAMVFLGAQAAAAVNSATGKSIEVKTLIDSTSFVLGTVDGVAMARDTNVSWMIVRQD